MNTLTLAGAAGFLKMHGEEVRCRAKQGLILVSKPPAGWVILPAAVRPRAHGGRQFGAGPGAAALQHRNMTNGLWYPIAIALAGYAFGMVFVRKAWHVELKAVARCRRSLPPPLHRRDSRLCQAQGSE